MSTALRNHADRLKRLFVASALMMSIRFVSAGGVDAAGSVVSTGVIPLSGDLGDVQIAGWLHVVVQYPGDPYIPTAIHVNLPPIDVVATDSLGGSYLVYGAGFTSLVCQLDDFCDTRIGGFTLRQVRRVAPADPYEPLPFNLDLRLKIKSDGTLDAAPGLGDVFPSFAVVAP